MNNNILELLKDSGAFMEGHFLLTSGRHSSSYFQCAKVLQHPKYLMMFGEILCNHFKSFGVEKVVSLGPLQKFHCYCLNIAEAVSRQDRDRPIFYEDVPTAVSGASSGLGEHPWKIFSPEAGSSPAMLFRAEEIEDLQQSRHAAPTAVKSTSAG